MEDELLLVAGRSSTCSNFLYDQVISIDSTKNNGNIVQQIITVPDSPGESDAFTATQKYYYDSLNRIDDATEDISGQSWRQDFSYDRYGNRNLVEANTTTIPKGCLEGETPVVCTADHKVYNPSANTSDNRLSSSDDYTFDAAGNTIIDAQERRFIYDGENKQVKVLDSGLDTVGEYFYDGDGKRVKKVVESTGEVTIFVYDAAGKQIAEYSTIVADTNDAKVAYLTNDHLGSPRINTDADGDVTARHDYHPFGEEISTAERTTHYEYTPDSVRKQFTGYERDNETELDFAQARIFVNTHGRYTSPDPLLSSGIIEDPQTWNRYVYVLNNPLALVDPSGLFIWSDALGGSDTDGDIEKKIQEARKNNNTQEADRLQLILDRRRSITDALREARMSGFMSAEVGTIEDSERLRQALDAYGEPGVDNGVTVGLADPSSPGYGAFGGATVVRNGRILVGFPEYVLANSSTGQIASPLLFAYVAHEGEHIIQAKKWLDLDPFLVCGYPYDPNDYNTEVAAYMVMVTAIRGNKNIRTNAGIGNPGAEIWKGGWLSVDASTMKANIKNGIEQHLLTLGRSPQSSTSAFPGDPRVLIR